LTKIIKLSNSISHDNRRALYTALAESGYKTWEEETKINSYTPKKYVVCFEISDEEMEDN
jgi:hypothetical protein